MNPEEIQVPEKPPSNWKVFQDGCMGFGALGSIFFLYILVLCLADPERLHIVHPVFDVNSQDYERKVNENHEHYVHAVWNAFMTFILYIGLTVVLWYKNYGDKERTKQMFHDFAAFFQPNKKQENYEQNQDLFEKAEEMVEVRK